MVSNKKLILFVVLLSTAIIYCVLLLNIRENTEFRPLSPLPPTQNDGFLIDTPGCRIPYIHHFHPSVRALYKATDGEFPKCNGLHFLIVKGNKIFLDERKFRENFGNVALKCAYKKIVRNPDNDALWADSKYGFAENKALNFGKAIKDEYIKVECYSGGKKLFEDFVSLLQLKPDVEKKCSDRSKQLSPQRLNVIMIAIDSVSKLNFLRHFDLTYKYLSDILQAFEFHGHTKVADNTFVNMMPMMTGHFHNYYRNKQDLRTKYFDDVDFIWKEYSSIGYRTFYAEDSPTIGTFTYLKKGFRYPPTDYYPRPFTIAIEKETPGHTYACLNSIPEPLFYNDYLLRFAQIMDYRPFFAWLFHSRLTHDLINHAGYMDRPALEILQQLQESGILNNSLLLFFSDHGIRFGKIRETYVGKIEERMPFMFLRLPPWFLRSHPNISRNLKINQRRLTTPFDIYQTLAHLVTIVSSKKVKQNKTLGMSLFEEIAPERTCRDAGISPHWCTCHYHVKVPSSNRNVQNAGQQMLDTINNWINSTKDSGPCAKLKVDKIVDARMSVPYKFLAEGENDLGAIEERSQKLGRETGNSLDYLITLAASPSNALLEGTVRYDGGNFTLIEASRINAYSGQSNCIQDPVLQKFCFCK